MFKLFLTSLFTLGLLAGMVFGLIMAVMVGTDSINILWALGLTVIFNFFSWLTGPWFQDWVNRWFNSVKFLTPEEVKEKYPVMAEIIEQVCQEYKFKFPKIGVIADANPTAFTYGSGRWNARIVVTEGLFQFLNPAEVRAVLAHELGHVVHRDFVVMAVANTLIQVMYQIYFFLSHSKVKNRKNGGALAGIALIALAFYYIGTYILLFLSRVREYYADRFSAEKTNPQDLANALFKVSYGIVMAEDTAAGKRLLESTRHLGIVDVKKAKFYTQANYVAHNDPNILAEVMLFDKLNPWAILSEFSSTHPLTGKRIDQLSKFSQTTNKPFSYDLVAAAERINFSYGKMYGGFFSDLFMSALPFLCVIPTYLLFFMMPTPWMFLGIVAAGVAVYLQLQYRYPKANFPASTVLEQMRNPYTSPLRGQAVSLSGQIIGRGIPGYIFGEDLMYQDRTGLVFVDYRSVLGWFGNLFFALSGKIKKLIGLRADVSGWFFRRLGSTLVLNDLIATDVSVNSYPRMWRLIWAWFLVAAGICLFVATMYTQAVGTF